MKNKHTIFILIILVVSGGLAIYFLGKENRELRDENDELLKDNRKNKAQLDEILKMIESDEEIDLSVRKKLSDIIQQYKTIDPDIAAELGTAANLIKSKEHSQAAFSLAKVVENLLKDKYKNDSSFQTFLTNESGKKRREGFNEYLDFAKASGHINKEQLLYAKGLKEIRNQVGHQNNVRKDSSWIHTAFYTGIGLILKLSSP